MGTAHPKPLNEQVIVVTGASSGIGLATIEAAAKKKAKLVLAARSIDTIQATAAGIEVAGGEALAVACDVSNREDVFKLADAVVQRFGRIDTWINNAGLGMHGMIEDVSLDDARALFDTNFWGVVYGSLAALPHLRKSSGTLINVGSEVSEAVAPLLGFYTASKHAVKGFTDSLRIEVEQVENEPVTVTLIQPTAVNTPFPEHSRNYMQHEPKLPSPTIDPVDVATAILKAAIKPTRSKKVGFKAIVNTTVATLMPSVSDRLSARLVDQQQYDEKPRHPSGILNRSCEACGTAGRTNGAGGHVRTHSGE